MILSELIQRAVDIAVAGIPDANARASAETTAEPLLPVIFARISERAAASSSTRSLLRRGNSITFTNGIGVLPETVLTNYLCESTLYDTALTTTRSRYAWVPQFQDLLRTLDQRLGHFTVNESTIYVVQPGASYIEGSGLSGALTLVTPCSVAVPTALGGAIAARDELVDNLITELAGALRSAVLAK